MPHGCFIIQYKTIKIKARTKHEFDERITFYTSKNNYLLDGESASATFEFNYDRLSIVQFNFDLHDDYQQWFDNQIAELTKLYGTESEKTENNSDELQMQTICYFWDTDTTSLQMVLVTGKTAHTSAVLSIGLR